MPDGSHVVADRRQMEHLRATCTAWSCLHQMGAMCAICKADGAIWEPLPARRGHMGARIGWMGATCAIWEPYQSRLWVWEVDDTTWGQHAPYGGHMGAMCTVQEPNGTISEADGAIWGSHVVLGSLMHHMGATCTICGPYGSHAGTMGCRGPHKGAMYRPWEPCSVDYTILE
jgi:hypothetical protein